MLLASHAAASINLALPELFVTPGFCDRFTYETVLGNGAFATVYQAWDADTQRRIAIKEVKKNGSKTPLTEYLIGKQFDHPCLIKTYDCIETNSFVYLILEACDGGDLFDRLQPQVVDSVTEREAHLWMEELTAGLRAMHSKGVVHLDVKPENVLIHKGHAVLCDFGVAARAGVVHTAMRGTGPYIAPEILASAASGCPGCASICHDVTSDPFQQTPNTSTSGSMDGKHCRADREGGIGLCCYCEQLLEEELGAGRAASLLGERTTSPSDDALGPAVAVAAQNGPNHQQQLTTTTTTTTTTPPQSPPQTPSARRKGAPYIVQPSADAWSVGIVLYAVLFADLPWEAAEVSDPDFAFFCRSGGVRADIYPYSLLSSDMCALLKSLLTLNPAKRGSLAEAARFFASRSGAKAGAWFGRSASESVYGNITPAPTSATPSSSEADADTDWSDSSSSSYQYHPPPPTLQAPARRNPRALTTRSSSSPNDDRNHLHL